MSNAGCCCRTKSKGVSPSVNSQKDDKSSFLQRIATVITNGLENIFAGFGLKIGNHPWKFIFISIFLAGLCGIGFLSFYEETDIDKLWVPEGSWIRENKEWIDNNFPTSIKLEAIIGVSDNILTPQGLGALMDIFQESLTIATSRGVKLNNVCLKSGPICIVEGILEIWSFNNATVRSLTQAQINSDVKNTKISPVYGNRLVLENYLGHITYHSNGDISAKAAIITWYINGNAMNESDVDGWEKEFIDLGLKGHSDLSETYVQAERSWPDESDKAIADDIGLLSIGYFVVFLFVVLSIGKFNQIEQKVWLSSAGFLCVGLSFMVAMGLGSAFGLPYGPVQRVLPFLLVGLGVDNMYVLVGALENLSPEERKLDVPQQISLVLRHGGVAITVTSVTDTVAFLIGANTIIPGLLSFCVYAGIGIVSLYILQCTIFTSCLALDVRRIQANRDACCIIRKLDDDYTPNECSQNAVVSTKIGAGLAILLANKVFKVVVILVFLGLLGVNLWGLTELEQYFDPFWFIPSDSYLTKFRDAHEFYFPDDGVPCYVYCTNINYLDRRSDFEKLDTTLIENYSVQNGTTDSWFAGLTAWLSVTNDASIVPLLNAEKYPTSLENFYEATHEFVTVNSTRFETSLAFLPPIQNITSSRFPYKHIRLEGSDNQINAMDSIRDLVKDSGFANDECFTYSFIYLTWETNRVIQDELYRNLGIAMICVFLVTLILIANLFTCTIVFVGVIATLVNVAGSMHFWDLTIDTVTSVILILSIGLAVDYSAHIGHTFMTVKGTRQERTTKTIEIIGIPVFFGGLSTFMAFVLLSQSTSYVFKTFFKVNFLVVIYGLFHGLVFLPVVLSLIGPPPYSQDDDESSDPEKAEDGFHSNGVEAGGKANFGFNHDAQGKENDGRNINMDVVNNGHKPAFHQGNHPHQDYDNSGSGSMNTHM